MSVTFVQDPDSAGRLREDLVGAGSVAVDCEAAGFHRYSDRICLIQLSTRERTWILDPLSVELGPFVAPALEDPDRPVIMHGAAYDLRLLQRDLDVEVAGLEDTQVAASLLGEPSVGLQALLERHLGVKVSKKHQRADWARRPLPDEMIEYAANDTRYLHELMDLLRGRVDEMGRLAWAEEEYAWLIQSAHAPDEKEDADPVTRVKGARKLDALACTALRAGLDWRDELARSLDRAPFRVISDQSLLEAAQSRPTSAAELGSMKGVSPRLADAHGDSLIRRFREIEERGAAELSPYPPQPPRAPRPAPEVEATFEALKTVRNQVAAEIGLDRGRVMANHLIMEIATAAPSDREELLAVGDVRAWQADLMGDRLIAALRRDGVQSASGAGS